MSEKLLEPESIRKLRSLLTQALKSPASLASQYWVQLARIFQVSVVAQQVEMLWMAGGAEMPQSGRTDRLC